MSYTFHNSTLRVSELFLSIQGESLRAGLPCGFVRLAGCNLSCRWCDTHYACDGGTDMPLGDILFQVTQWKTPLVEITGGEPLLQSGSIELARALLNSGHTVLVESNGSLPIARLPEGVVRIMDLKCPDSGMSERVHWDNVNDLTPDDEVKFVLASRGDYEWALSVVRRYELDRRCGAILLSPVTGLLAPAMLAAWMVEDRPPARLQLQLHKMIWGADARGV